MSERFEVPCFLKILDACPSYCPTYQINSKTISDMSVSIIATESGVVSALRLWFENLSAEEQTKVRADRLATFYKFGEPSAECLNFESSEPYPS